MSYKTCSAVIDSWEDVRNIENYEEKVGVKLFAKFFELEPDARRIFGFRETQSMEDMVASRRFYKHAAYFIQSKCVVACVVWRVHLYKYCLTYVHA